MEYGEEAGLAEFLFRPADLEQVVRSLQALLHLYVVLCDDAVEGAVDRPYSLHITVVLDGAQRDSRHCDCQSSVTGSYASRFPTHLFTMLV